jgi:hypothetical protein
MNKEESAIDIDAPEDTPAVKSQRELAMESIAAGRTDYLSAEIGHRVDEDPAEIEPEEVVKVNEAIKIDEEVSKQLDDGLLHGDLGKVKVLAKIDGEEVEVTVDQMLRQYQKNSAADKRLADATRILEQAKAQQIKPEPEKEPPPEIDELAVGKEFINSMMEGDEEKALQAWVKATRKERNVPTPEDSTKLEEKLTSKVTQSVKQQIEAEAVLSQFQKDFPEIPADPYLAQLAETFWQEELNSGKGFGPGLQEAGKRVRDWLGEKTGGKQKDDTTTIHRAEKLDRKSGIDTIPGANVRATTVEEPVQNASSIIAEMRKARGG